MFRMVPVEKHFKFEKGKANRSIIISYRYRTLESLEKKVAAFGSHAAVDSRAN